MSEKVELILEDRLIQGKAVKALRKQGYMPGVVYGEGEPHNVMAPQALMLKAYHSAGKHHPIELHLGKLKRLAMIKSVDIDPVKHTVRHLAFHAIKQNEKVETEVPIVILGAGETPAEKAGFILLTTIDTVEIEALPNDLPDNLEVSGEQLTVVGDRLTIADLKVPKAVTILSELEQVIATVYEPSALVAQNEALAGEATDDAAAEAVEAEHGEEVAPTQES